MTDPQPQNEISEAKEVMASLQIKRPKVQGHCSECGRDSLELTPDGKIICSDERCPDQYGLQKVINIADIEHVVHLDPWAFKIQHPISERKNGNLFDCPLDKYMNEQTMAPQTPGNYRVKSSGDPTSPWVWEAI